MNPNFWYGEEDAEYRAVEASNSLAARVAKLAGLKPFPVVAQRVSQMVADPNCRIEALGRLIESDPAVAARLMRLANSALFCVGQPADTLEQALVRLGTSTIYQMVTALAVMGLFNGDNDTAMALRDHCVGVAALGRTLARQKGWAGSSQVFLCCLMHDLGKLLNAQTNEIDYASFSPEELVADRMHLRERQELGYDHAVLGAHVSALWNLPDVVAQTIALHHQPERAYGADKPALISTLVAYVRVANWLDHALQKHDDFEQLRSALEANPDLRHCGVTALDIEQHWADLVDSRTNAQNAFA